VDAFRAGWLVGHDPAGIDRLDLVIRRVRNVKSYTNLLAVRKWVIL
jgi:hypothetical protein